MKTETPQRLGLLGDAHGNGRCIEDALRALAGIGVHHAVVLGDWGLWFRQSSLEKARRDTLVQNLERTAQ